MFIVVLAMELVSAVLESTKMNQISMESQYGTPNSLARKMVFRSKHGQNHIQVWLATLHLWISKCIMLKVLSWSIRTIARTMLAITIKWYESWHLLGFDQSWYYIITNDSKSKCEWLQSVSRIQIKDVKYENIRGTSAKQLAVTLNCSQVVPCQGIALNNINLVFNGSGSSTSVCQNIQGSASGPQLPPSCL